MSLRYIVIIGVFLFLASCRKDTIAPPVDMGYAYYPLSQGNYRIFQVDSIDYNEFTQQVDTFRFQIKFQIGESFYDNSERLSWRLMRFYRENDNDSWQEANTWYITPTPERIESVEDNIRYMRFAFPVRVGLKWNGNAFNSNEELEYRYVDTDIPYSIGMLDFDSCSFVLQQDEVTLISQDYAEEIYARGVGLIYKRFLKYRKNTAGIITGGVEYTYRIIEYGEYEQ